MKQLKRTVRQPLTKSQRKPLAFVKPAADPTQSLPDIGGIAETQMHEEVKALKIGMVERMKADAKRKKLAVAADDHFVLAFESNEQANAFLKAIAYPWPDAAFVDGTIVAELLNITLPSALKQHRLKMEHDRKLTRLVDPTVFRR